MVIPPVIRGHTTYGCLRGRFARPTYMSRLRFRLPYGTPCYSRTVPALDAENRKLFNKEHPPLTLTQIKAWINRGDRDVEQAIRDRL